MNVSPRPADAYLTVRALDRHFAVPAGRARAVFAISTLTAVAGAPARVVGLTNYRGAVVAVFCLARRLDPRAPAAGVGGSAIAIEWGEEIFALAVESVGGVVDGHDLAPTDAVDGPEPRPKRATIPILDLRDLFEAPFRAEADEHSAAPLKHTFPGDRDEASARDR